MTEEFVTSLLHASDGNYYGTTVFGGTALKGTIFKVTPAGIYSIVHNFQDGSVAGDGRSPSGLMQGSDGNLYGATISGGSTVAIDPNHSGYGCLFKLTTSGVLTVLHNFSDGSVTNDALNQTRRLWREAMGTFTA